MEEKQFDINNPYDENEEKEEKLKKEVKKEMEGKEKKFEILEKFDLKFEIPPSHKELKKKDGIIEISSSQVSCCICFAICQIPMECTSCGCLACKFCYENTIMKESNMTICPNCRKVEAKFNESKIIKRIIDSIITHCIVPGCERDFEREFYRNHLLKDHDNNNLIVKEWIQKFDLKEPPKEWNEVGKFPLHRHIMTKLTNQKGFCNSKKFIDAIGNCKQIINESDEFYYCESCNLWFCLNCVEKECTKFYIKGHEHALEFVFIDKGWNCDGLKLEDKCRSGNYVNFSSERRMRYRCSKCDADYCGNCMDFYNKY